MYRYCLVFAVLCGFVISAHADIYKWVDPNGVVHYSDVPGSPNAVQVQITDPTVPSSSGVNNTQPTSPQGAAMPAQSGPSQPSSLTVPPPTPQQQYTSVKITEPTDEYTYVNNESGDIVVKLALAPELQQGNFVQILFDGSPVGKPQETTSLKIQNIDRGEHTVQAQILDSSGAVIASSNKVKFYLQRIKVMNRSSQNGSGDNLNVPSSNATAQNTSNSPGSSSGTSTAQSGSTA